MVLDFSWLPPEINSARIFTGAGSAPLHVAATAWDGLAADLHSSATSFQSVITQLTTGPWSGPASTAMAAAATPYVGWLSTAAAQAQSAAASARAAAAAFETALTATVHPALVSANRTTLSSLVNSNFLGQNSPAIAQTEFQYVEMWATDVAAMLGYHSGATSVASSMSAFSLPSLSLSGLSGWLSSAEGTLSSGVSSIGAQLGSEASSLGLSGVYSSIQSAVSSVPLSSVMSVAQIGMYPASMLISPMMSLAQMGGHAAPALAGATDVAGETPKFVGDVKPLSGLGGGGGLGGAGMAAELGKARLVGAVSVPPTWQGSQPSRMVSAAMSGMGSGGFQNAAAMGQPAAGGGMPMMPMPMGGGAGAGGGMPLGRGGASPHVTQNRPSVIPRTGV